MCRSKIILEKIEYHKILFIFAMILVSGLSVGSKDEKGIR